MITLDNNITQLSDIIDGHRAACELFQQSSGNTLRTAIIQRDNRIAELESETELLRDENAQLRNTIDSLNAQLEQSNQSITDLNARIDAAQQG